MMQTLPNALSRRSLNHLLRFSLSDGSSAVVLDAQAPADVRALADEIFAATQPVRFTHDGAELEGRDGGVFADALNAIADGEQAGRRWCIAMAWHNELLMGQLSFAHAN